MISLSVAGPSTNDGFDPNANASVRCFAVQPNGKILIGGDFTSVAGGPFNRVARLNADGTTDTTFASTGADGSVLAIALQSDGKILIGGRFTQVGSADRKYFARLNTNGTLDTGFNYSFSGAVTGIAVQTDGKIVCVGEFPTHVIRLSDSGSTDPAFNPGSGADGNLNAVALQPDGKILVGGSSMHFNGAVQLYVARLLKNGALDTSFNPITVNDSVNSIALQADGKIILGGAFVLCQGYTRNGITRLYADGVIDKTFNPGTASRVVNSVAIQPDGKIVAGGTLTVQGQPAKGQLTQFRLDGSTDPAFSNPATSDTIRAVAVQPDGKILLGGDFTKAAGTIRNRLARVYPDGTLDTQFHPAPPTFVDNAVIQPDWRIVATLSGWTDRVNVDGTDDPGFERSSGCDAIAARKDGKILAAGGGSLWLLSPAGKRYYGLQASRMIDLPDKYTHYLALCGDDDVFVNSTSSDGWNPAYAACVKLHADGSAYDSFFHSMAFGTIALQTDQKLLMAMSGYEDVERLNPDGSSDATFKMPRDNITFPLVRAIAVQPDGKVLAGGEIATVDGLKRNAIVRLNANGSVDAAFNSPVYPKGNKARIEALLLQSNGKILALAHCSDVATTAVFPRLARLNPDGSLDPSFSPIWSHSLDNLDNIALQPDGKILFGGNFNITEGGRTYSIFTRFPNSEAALQKLSVTASGRTVTWELGGSFPWPYQVMFEQTADGTTWTRLGYGYPVQGVGYRLTGAYVMRDHYVRATGYVACGRQGGSVSTVQSVLWVADGSVPYTSAGAWASYR